MHLVFTCRPVRRTPAAVPVTYTNRPNYYLDLPPPPPNRLAPSYPEQPFVPQYPVQGEALYTRLADLPLHPAPDDRSLAYVLRAAETIAQFNDKFSASANQ